MIKRILLFICFVPVFTFAQPYPDQFYSYQKDSLVLRVESFNGTQISPDGKKLILSDGVTNGSITFIPDSSEYPFDQGLPSWNGHAPNDNSSFKVLIRFYKGTWTPWLTVGFWKNNIWSSYGITSFNNNEIKIDIDWAVLKSYYKKWQFAVLMKRTNSSEPSPSIHKLSFFVSDHKTTDNVNISSIIKDKPAEIFIPTHHYYQYGLDPGIGGDICSPTSVCMVLRSYNIDVDPLQFARDNYDSYWGIFGIWPKAVQNAAEHSLDGEVTRYRTWSQTRDVLANGGRIVMSVGSPLYPIGHLMMLAGFNENGYPLVHDPAKSNGYDYEYNITSLSESWFNKGGVAYTFYPEDSSSVTSTKEFASAQIVDNYNLSVYPNPFNPQTNISFENPKRNYTEITVYDITGREITKLFNNVMEAGSHSLRWDASNFPSGMYFIRIISGNYSKTIKALLVK